MTYDQIIARLGLTQNMTEMLIMAGLAVIVIGFLIVTFLPYLVAGAVLYAVVTVFSHQAVPEPKTEQIVEKDAMTDKETYLQECKDLIDKESDCEESWKDRSDIILKSATEEVVKEIKQAAKVKLLDVDNAEYKTRRAAALKKPGAVVIQTTFSDHDR